MQRALSAHRCASPELAVDTPAPVIHVTARQGVVWAVTEQGSYAPDTIHCLLSLQHGRFMMTCPKYPLKYGTRLLCNGVV